jgi:TonB family protein
MYLDFQDHRPDPPRVPSAISRREGILLSLVIHLVLTIVILVMPAPRAVAEEDIARVLPTDEPVQFVYMEPLVERPAPPPPQAEISDLDRQSSAPDPQPEAEIPVPFSEGNTADKVIGAPEETLAGPEAPSGPVTPPAPPPEPSAVLLPGPATPPTTVSGGNLGDSLRDLQRYLRDENFDNQQGGLVENGPDIQFDSRGVEFGPWLRRFVAQLKSNWNIPMAAMTNRGSVVVQFYVHKNGTVAEVEVVRESLIEGFNTAAYNAVRMSNPTLPLPPEYPLEAAFFTVTFKYNERQLLLP